MALKPSRPLDMLKHFACGFLMGLADLIPGISGGTVAFILGIWETLIFSIRDLASSFARIFRRGNSENSSGTRSLLFLCPLLLGIALAILLFTKTVDALLNNPIDRVYLYSAFFGLIIASCILCLGKIGSWSFARFLLFCASAGSAFYLTNAKPLSEKGMDLYTIPLENSVKVVSPQPLSNYVKESHQLTGVDLAALRAMVSKGIIGMDQNLIDETSGKEMVAKDLLHESGKGAVDLWIVFCGAAAISAMLLPGVSGSFLLVVLGMYGAVIGNVADFVSGLQKGSLDQDSFFFLLQFALGILLGAACFSKIIGALFTKFHDAAMASIAGFVAGSLGAVWPFWSYGYVLDPIKIEKGARLLTLEPFIPGIGDPLVLAAACVSLSSFAMVFFIEYLANRKIEQKNCS